MDGYPVLIVLKPSPQTKGDNLSLNISKLLPTILVQTQIRNMLGGETDKFTSGKNKVKI